MSKKLWGGRFKKEMHPALRCFSYSLAVDKELFDAELAVNAAWAKMLARTAIITQAESKAILKGLARIEKDLEGKDIARYVAEVEDIHTLIQSELEKRSGAVAKKLHTGRSRNDLVVTSTRVCLREKIAVIRYETSRLQKALVAAAEKAQGAIVPGMTHLRKAQPVLLAHHLLAYVEMLEEDKARLADTLKRVNILPIGSAALAGSALPIDQKFLAKELGFEKIARNSMTAVSDRGFLAEFLANLSILWMHLSRLAEDFILWNSEAFGYVELDDAFATGSSLMPQKKNPDVFELVRGRAGVIFGHLQSILTVQKGLPLSYNRDLQEDKPGAFDAVHKTTIALEVLALTVASATWQKKAMAKAVADDTLFATDILEYLVRKKVPFSEAHSTVGQAVRFAAESGKGLRELSLREWKRFSPGIGADIYDLFDPETSVRGKKTIGSTHPLKVRQQMDYWTRLLA
ncbi:MAG: Argininosuccinate lyase [Candidatus Omnitrophica bacterium ADurb.Bin314]|jgi:argininosuccinate lyase|nr:MAG: Argininosuccinate lyase [Candidatus Omnitrophica bacterium ADurb.Bin314]HOE68330.1 argininosuccinate lyase [Candidatus Omnitrophota bacterium]HPW65155.1 argininosuccinate lyase [Candidatus Omnitrophota bacterium]